MIDPRTEKSTRPTLRFLAAALAALWFAGQVSGALHLLSVPHDFCLEHGELVDSEQSQRPGESLATARVSEVERLLRATVVADQQHSHDHCAVSIGMRRKVVPVGGIALATIPVTPEVESFPLSSLTPAPAVALLHLAPKSSPPS